MLTQIRPYLLLIIGILWGFISVYIDGYVNDYMLQLLYRVGGVVFVALGVFELSMHYKDKI